MDNEEEVVEESKPTRVRAKMPIGYILLLCAIPFLVTGILAAGQGVFTDPDLKENQSIKVTSSTKKPFWQDDPNDKIEIATVTREAYTPIALKLSNRGIPFTVKPLSSQITFVVALRDADATASVCWEYHASHPGSILTMNTYR